VTEVPISAAAYPELPKPAQPVAKADEPVNTAIAQNAVETPALPKVTKPKAVAPSSVKVTVVIRPWGELQVDGAPKSKPDTVHQLELAPGPHVFKVTCQFCEAAGRTLKREVRLGDPMEIKIPAPLMPGYLVFGPGFPDEALVRVGSEERTVKATRDQPFKIPMPSGGSASGRYSVAYEVVAPGFKPRREKVEVAAGQKLVVPGGLEKP
jgi:hypothetical protein